MEEPVIIGQKIKNIRLSTKQEMAFEGWDEKFQVIVLENGTKLYPSSDYEGNSSGGLFGVTNDGNSFGI